MGVGLSTNTGRKITTVAGYLKSTEKPVSSSFLGGDCSRHHETSRKLISPQTVLLTDELASATAQGDGEMKW